MISLRRALELIMAMVLLRGRVVVTSIQCKEALRADGRSKFSDFVVFLAVEL